MTFLPAELGACHRPSRDLFAALNMAIGSVITDIRKAHTIADFIVFFEQGRTGGAPKNLRASKPGYRLDVVETLRGSRPARGHVRLPVTRQLSTGVRKGKCETWAFA